MPRTAPRFEPVAAQADADAESLCADGALSVSRAARFCGLKVGQFRTLLAAGEIATLKVGKLRVVPRRALVRFLAAKLAAQKGT